MLDFLTYNVTPIKRGGIEIAPDFKVIRSGDLMIRGGALYAIWDNESNVWCSNEYEAQLLIDKELEKEVSTYDPHLYSPIEVKWLKNFSTGSWKSFKDYIKNLPDYYHTLDNKIVFKDDIIKKQDYISKTLPYPISDKDCPSYKKLISTLYSPEEVDKIEWAIGSVFVGDSKKIQKFIVFYGEGGTGKSTILNIIGKLFEGYTTTFDAKDLTSKSNAFATEVFQNNPLVAIQQDGKLSKIEDNSKFNSIISHEDIVINQKYKSTYSDRINAMLFMGTNEPVKISDGKSGLIRRIIDVTPTGNLLPPDEYRKLMKDIYNNELGSIAYHCINKYNSLGIDYYQNYKPLSMMAKTDPFFNFVEDNFDEFKRENGCSLKKAYTMYKKYNEESLVQNQLPKYIFREELKNYFDEFLETKRIDGVQVRSYYSGFRTDKFNRVVLSAKTNDKPKKWDISSTNSNLDIFCANDKAQLASEKGFPIAKWVNTKTTLKDIDTTKLHFVKLGNPNHIVIDFDLKDDAGKKDINKNMNAIEQWPLTYAELSKSGGGIHLHYIYDGDIDELSALYSTGIEIKIFKGDSSLRRKLSYCNNEPINHISQDFLPKKIKNQKGDHQVINKDLCNTESLTFVIKKCLDKQYDSMPSTTQNINHIKHILDDAYNSGMCYDVTVLRNDILYFASNSTNQALSNIKKVMQMKFKSDDNVTCDEEFPNKDGSDIVIYDIEVLPNLVLVCWKRLGKGNVNVMFNPSPNEIDELMKMKLVGHNCKKYDNHIIYGRSMGYSIPQCYQLSKRIIDKSENCFFSEAYNISFTDTYDMASAANKKSLKKWEIELGLKHDEMEVDWNEPLPEDKWNRLAEYCKNDVLATEALFEYLKPDWLARKILANMAKSTYNASTNSLTTKIIFKDNRHPQQDFNYRDLSKPVKELDPETLEFLTEACPEMMKEKHGPDGQSLLPYFSGYKMEYGKSTYRGEEISEGGQVYAEPGMHYMVALLDIASQHPHSLIAECLLGVEFTRRFREIVLARISIKHEEWEELDTLAGGILKPFVEWVKNGTITSKDLANALKTAINSVYGLTDAGFPNPFRDPRNVDNIVAKRGALFMVDLKHEVQKRGFTVAHIKTDSIKIPNATKEIIDFVMQFGKRYGYTFEHEATYERMCLVNNAVYIAKNASSEACEKLYGYIPDENKKHPSEWTATGAQFQQPYVFKTLFTKEPITLDDCKEIRQVKTCIYLHDIDTDEYHFVGKVGAFYPVKKGYQMVRTSTDKNGNTKYDSVTNTKDFMWDEDINVTDMSQLDMQYYRKMVDDALENMNKYGNAEEFINSETVDNKIA